MKQETATVYRSLSGRRYFRKKTCIFADCRFAVIKKYGSWFDHKSDWIGSEDCVKAYNRLLRFVLWKNGYKMKRWDEQELVDFGPKPTTDTPWTYPHPPAELCA